VHTYFGQINPLTSLTDSANYRSSSFISATQSEIDYGSASIKEIFSRWIPAFGRTIADRLGNILIGRFKDPPRKFAMSVMRNSTPEIRLASGYQVQGWPIQDATGALQTANVQVTRLRPNADTIEIETEEVLFTAPPEDLNIRNIIVDADTTNINLRTIHDTLFPAPDATVILIATINSGVKVSSTSRALVSIDVGSWPTGVTIIVSIAGGVRGAGGRGGDYNGGGGIAGGTAIFTRFPIKLANTGTLWGGGGGGGGTTFNQLGGGGGAGLVPGIGGTGPGDAGGKAPDGTETTGGAAISFGGAGGGPGLAGGGTTAPSANTAGGAAGFAIDGVSFVTKGTWDGTTFTTTGTLGGDVRGTQGN
jgi:hypothetical protein